MCETHAQCVKVEACNGGYQEDKNVRNSSTKTIDQVSILT